MKKTIFSIAGMFLFAQAMIINAATVNEVQANLNDQAAAIKQLAQIINDLQRKSGSSYGVVDIQGIDVPARLEQNKAAQANQLLQTANNQAKALNQIAEITMRLQHQAGILPEDIQNVQQQTQQPGAVQ